jgi:hypothetical protein
MRSDEGAVGIAAEDKGSHGRSDRGWTLMRDGESSGRDRRERGRDNRGGRSFGMEMWWGGCQRRQIVKQETND